jgi:hypothetical protein
MLHIETVQPDTLGLLKRIQSLPVLSGTRLVGGTALVLQLGHRESIVSKKVSRRSETVCHAQLGLLQRCGG